MVTAKSLEGRYPTEITAGAYKFYANSPAGETAEPLDLLQGALAACMNITTRMVLERMNLPCEGVEVKVSLERPDREHAVVRYDIDIRGDLDEETKRQVRAKVLGCPVRRTLSSEFTFLSDRD